MKKEYSIGVVGLGYWGPNLVRNFNAIPECRLSAVCDENSARLTHITSLYNGVHGHKDYDAMLNDDSLDAVAIATPVRSHYKLAKAALEAGKHTLIEKPMASSTEQCDELIEIAEKNGLTLMVGHTFLYSEPVRRIREIIQNGDIGDLHFINSQRLNLGLFQKDINVAWDLAPHDISIILHILGESPLVVNCQGNAHMTNGVEDVTNMSLSFRSNRFATIQSSWIEPRKVRQMTIVGSKRMIVYDDVEPREKIRVYDVRVEHPPYYDTFAEFHFSYHYGDSYIPHVAQEEPLKRMCTHFLECIDTGAQPISSGAQGRELVRILEASLESVRANGAPIPLSKPDDTFGGNGHSMAPANRPLVKA